MPDPVPVPQPPGDDASEMDSFMLGVLMRQHYEERADRRTNYLLALDWVLDAWRDEDDPVRRRLTQWAAALDLAMDDAAAAPGVSQ